MVLRILLLTPGLASALSLSPAYQRIAAAKVVDPATGGLVSPLDGLTGKSLVVVLPQLGDFDTAEICEQLVAVDDALKEAELAVRVVGIGDAAAASKFSAFTGLPLDQLRVDPDGALHRELGLHAGPGWTLPDAIGDGLLKPVLSLLPGGAPADEAQLRPAAEAWLNYLAMCAGVGSPGTLREILRGYTGDATAPERLTADAVVRAGPVSIGPGVGPVEWTMPWGGEPLGYENWWADERGYQRPLELATVRLRNMVEVISGWDEYVTNPAALALRGATFVFDADGNVEYEWRTRGVLTYSETPARPLSFLAPYVGEAAARNPLGLGDDAGAGGAGAGGAGAGAGAGGAGVGAGGSRGLLKVAGRAMGLLAPVFAAENRLQAAAMGVDDDARAEARAQIDTTCAGSPVVVYTYGLSPFSSEAVALLEAAGAAPAVTRVVEVGPEWFLLGKEGSALRAELLALTGQSSLPSVFIGGRHHGGLFTGTAGAGPGLAALRESGELAPLLQRAGALAE